MWFEWVGEYPEQRGVRACVEAAMAWPKLLAEIKCHRGGAVSEPRFLRNLKVWLVLERFGWC